MDKYGLKASIAAFLLVVIASPAAATIDSADTITYESNRQFFDGQILHVGFTSNPGTEKINVFLGQSEIESRTGAVAEEDLTLDVTHQNTYARYPTQDTGLEDIYNWDLLVTDTYTYGERDDLWLNIRASCADVTSGGVEFNGETSKVDAKVKKWYGIWTGQAHYKAYCWNKNGKKGSVADIGSPDDIFRTEWQLQAGNKNPQTAVITNGDGGSGVVSNLGRYAKVRWGGSLGTGEDPPAYEDELALHSNSFDNGWRIVSDGEYKDYTTYLENNANRLLEKVRSGDYSESYAEGLVNTRADVAASEFSDSPLSNAEILDSSFPNGALKVDMSRSLAYPTFDVYVDAGENGYITVSKPVGEPDITSKSGAEFGELGQGTVSVDVKNVGERQGSFSGRIQSCGEYFQGNSLQETKSVDPGKTATFRFRVTFTSQSLTQSEFSGQCEVVVEDTGSGNEVSTDVSVTAIQETECSEGDETKKERTIDDREHWVIYSCPNGLKLEEEQVCGPDQVAPYVNKEVQYECRYPGTTGTGGSGWTVPGLGWEVKNPASGFGEIFSGTAGALTYAQILLSVIGFLAGFALLGIKLGAMIDGLATEFIAVSDAAVRLGLGLLGGVLAFLTVYQFVTSPLGFVLTILGLGAAGYLYVSAGTPDIEL